MMKQSTRATATTQHGRTKPVIKFERITTGEWVWQCLRERVPENDANWWKYILLLGPQPGSRPDPNEIYPGKLAKLKAQEKPRKDRKAGRYGGGPRPAAIERVPTPPAVLSFREKVFKHLLEKHSETGGIPPEESLKLAYLMGYAPSEEDKAKLGTQPMDQRNFDNWLRSIEHHEDQDIDCLLEPFRVLDPKETGTINQFALNVILTSFGEKLTEEEVVETIKRIHGGSGPINYEAFVTKLVPRERVMADSSTIEHVLGLQGLNTDEAA